MSRSSTPRVTPVTLRPCSRLDPEGTLRPAADVLAPLAQGRDHDPNGAQPLEQIHAKATGFATSTARSRWWRRGPARRAAASPRRPRAQNSRSWSSRSSLTWTDAGAAPTSSRNKRAVVGELDPSRARLDRLVLLALVTEQLGFGRVRAQGSQVDPHEALVLTGAVEVDGSGDPTLSSSGLPFDQHRCARRGHVPDSVPRYAPPRANCHRGCRGRSVRPAIPSSPRPVRPIAGETGRAAAPRAVYPGSEGLTWKS